MFDTEFIIGDDVEKILGAIALTPTEADDIFFDDESNSSAQTQYRND